jgi:hypothetical protein
MLVVDHISFPSPRLVWLIPLFLLLRLLFDPSIPSFFPITIGLQDFQDHEAYPLIVDVSHFQSQPLRNKKKSTKGKVAKKSYESTKKFQIEWVAKMPWAKGIVSQDGFINLVKCRIYSLIERKEKTMGYKWYTLTKHQGYQLPNMICLI